MKHSEAIKRIDQTFMRLACCCEHKREWQWYLDQHRKEETDHRRFKPDSLPPDGLTRAQAVRLFACQALFKCFVVEQGCERIFVPQAKDIFSIRPSIFGAFAIADLCQDRILKEFPLSEMKDFVDTIDYAELMKEAV